MVRKKEEFSLGRIFAFGSPAFAMGALGLPLVIFLPPLYAEMGIDLALVGFLFMMVRLFDMGTDPILGVVGDHVRSRWGRRRPVFVAAVPFLFVGGLLVFNPPAGVGATYLVLSMILLYVGWTCFTLSHTAWAGELSGQYHQRTRILSVVQGLGAAGVLFIILVPVVYDQLVEASTLAGQASTMAWFIFLPVPFLVFLALKSFGEPSYKPPQPLGFLYSVGAVLSNHSLRRVLTADLLGGFGAGVAGALHFFFVGQVLLMPDAANPFLLVLFLSSILFLPLWVKASYRFGKHRTLCFGSLIQCIASTLVFFIPSGNFFLGIVIYLMIGLNAAGSASLLRSMMVDVIDEDHVRTGQNRGALFFSLFTMTNKLGLALAVGISYPLLAFIGFAVGDANEQASLDGLRYVMAIFPGVAQLSVLLLMWNFPLDQKRQAELQTELRRREQADG